MSYEEWHDKHMTYQRNFSWEPIDWEAIEQKEKAEFESYWKGIIDKTVAEYAEEIGEEIPASDYYDLLEEDISVDLIKSELRATWE